MRDAHPVNWGHRVVLHRADSRTFMCTPPHAAPAMGSANMEHALSALYCEDQVGAIIALKVDTKEADRIATEVAKFDVIQDVFLVTGDTDIVAKARFANYKGLKDFVLNS